MDLEEDEKELTRQIAESKLRARKTVIPATTTLMSAVKQGKQPAHNDSDEDGLDEPPLMSGAQLTSALSGNHHTSEVYIPPQRPSPHYTSTGLPPTPISTTPDLSKLQPQTLPDRSVLQPIISAAQRNGSSKVKLTMKTYTEDLPRKPTSSEQSSVHTSPTAVAEATLLFSNDKNPYRYTNYKTFLLNSPGAGSRFIAEIEGSIPHCVMA